MTHGDPPHASAPDLEDLHANFGVVTVDQTSASGIAGNGGVEITGRTMSALSHHVSRLTQALFGENQTRINQV